MFGSAVCFGVPPKGNERSESGADTAFAFFVSGWRMVGMEGKVPPLPLVAWIKISIRGRHAFESGFLISDLFRDLVLTLGKGGTLPSKGVSLRDRLYIKYRPPRCVRRHGATKP